MLGIPFTVRRHSEEGVMDTTLYLTSRRRGDAGKSMRLHLRQFRQADLAKGKAASRAGFLMARAIREMAGDGAAQPDDGARLAELERIDAEQQTAMGAAFNENDAAMTHAEKIAELALRENYGPATDGIVDGLTSAELRAIVETVEMGAMPKDFFLSLATPPTPPSTGPSGSAPDAPSSMPDSAGATSSPAGSGWRMQCCCCRTNGKC